MDHLLHPQPYKPPPDGLSQQIRRNHRRREQRYQYPAARMDGCGAEHPADPQTDIMRDVGRIDDHRHNQHNRHPDLNKSRILSESAKDTEPCRAHSKPVHQRSEHEQEEIRRIVLRPSVKTGGKARIGQKGKAEPNEPRPHPEDLQ